MENEKHEIVEKIIALNANKIQISDRKVVPIIYFPNNSSGIAFISFWLLSLIVGVVGGFLLSVRFGDIKFFFGDYSQAKEKVKKNTRL